MAVLTLAFFVIGVVHTARPADRPPRDLMADTWVATDAIGRTMPGYTEAGPLKTGRRRVVGVFYITWHRDALAKLPSPYGADVSKILAEAPGARLDADHPLWRRGAYHAYHWGQPELGYFLSKDTYVIRKDMSMLSDAGVDVLVMDVTNAVRYWDEWDVVFTVMRQMRSEGNKTPKFCFWAFNGPVITVVQDLYDRIYKTHKYEDLWFYWDDKPLLLYNGTPTVDANGRAGKNPNPHYDPAAKTDTQHPHYGDPDFAEPFYQDYTQEVKAFFTLRTMWWGYYQWAGKRFIGTEDNWCFGYDMGDPRVQAMEPGARLSTHKGRREQAAVTPAQHPSSLIGKSWMCDHGEPKLDEYDRPVPTRVPWLGKTVEHPEGYGIYFQQRWDEALRADPQFLYINDWNEWTAGKYHPPKGTTFHFMRRKSTYRFIDQYNAEFNRAIQPMHGGYTDNYYMQMVRNIRRYKGVRPRPELHGVARIQIDGRFADWRSLPVEYRDTAGDTAHRDYPGYGGRHYTNDSGRNDIVTCKVAIDRDNVYFFAETTSPLTSHEGKNWMLLLIDADHDHDTGWYGYDYLINRNVVDGNTTTLMRYAAANTKQRWIEQNRLEYRYRGTALEIAVPRREIGLGGSSLTFDFHWCDNPRDLRDPISLCTDGDSAPNRRFNYRCVWSP